VAPGEQEFNLLLRNSLTLCEMGPLGESAKKTTTQVSITVRLSLSLSQKC